MNHKQTETNIFFRQIYSLKFTRRPSIKEKWFFQVFTFSGGWKCVKVSNRISNRKKKAKKNIQLRFFFHLFLIEVASIHFSICHFSLFAIAVAVIVIINAKKSCIKYCAGGREDCVCVCVWELPIDLCYLMAFIHLIHLFDVFWIYRSFYLCRCFVVFQFVGSVKMCRHKTSVIQTTTKKPHSNET